jgi:acetylornithine deacetylase/succinyl-diaminopimelate desuccinylase-like protein
MRQNTTDLETCVRTVRSMMDIIIANIVLIGQIPAPTFKEQERAKLFLDRLSEFHVGECTSDGYNNPIGIIRGRSRDKPPIFVVAHLDTPFSADVDHNFTIQRGTISGAGLLDNSLGVGVLASLPSILHRLDLQFESDIVLAAVLQSIGKGNLRGIRHLLKTWSTPIRGAVCIESGEIGRLNYYSDGMMRCEISCKNDGSDKRVPHCVPNAILVLNDVINQILELRLPSKPRTEINIGTIAGGLKHGQIPSTATMGLEIRSDSGVMVGSLYTDIRDIVMGVGHEHGVQLQTKTISNVRAARLKHNHPLVKRAASIIKRLGIQPNIDASESELSIFLSHNIPALTLGITHGQGYQQRDAKIEIEPMFKGIAQIIGVLEAIDSGVCDE